MKDKVDKICQNQDSVPHLFHVIPPIGQFAYFLANAKSKRRNKINQSYSSALPTNFALFLVPQQWVHRGC